MFARTFTIAIAVLCLVGTTAFAQPQSAEPPTVILFENVHIFDGKSDTLSGSMNVLVRGNTIDKISKDPIPIDRSDNTNIIAGGGRTLMPGLIDMHWHTMLVRPTVAALLAGDIGHLNLMAGAEAADPLMRGFTTVRDMGGPAFGLGAPSMRAPFPVRASTHPAPSSPSPAAMATSASRSRCRRAWCPAVPRGTDRCCHDRRQSR
jgi:hypothetical protein